MNFINWIIERWLKRKGFDAKRAIAFRKNYMRAWKKSNHCIKEKLWAARHGFYADKLDLYRLAPSNYESFFSDYEHLWLHPFNNHFAFWINDKITLKYILQKPFLVAGKQIDIMPEYYLYIENDGHYTYLMDSPKDIDHGEDYVLNLLKIKKLLAIKPSNGSLGQGFYRVEIIDSKIYVNGEHFQQDFMEFVQTLKGYIVTEYCRQHHVFNDIWKDSECTLRIYVIQESMSLYADAKPIIIESYARFGTKKSRGTSNLSSGGIGVAIDFETGICDKQFFSKYPYEDTGLFVSSVHPDSGYLIEGMKIPNWEMVKLVVFDICKRLSTLEMLGLDIIITESDLKLCEINSLPDVDAVQALCGPLYFKPDFKSYIDRKKIEKQNGRSK